MPLDYSTYTDIIKNCMLSNPLFSVFDTVCPGSVDENVLIR